MTKASKILTILVTVFSILYMGISFMMWTVRADWKEKANVEFPKKRITDQQSLIQELEKDIAATDKQHDDAKKAIAADIVSITAPQIGREAQLEAEWAALSAEASAIAGQVDAEAKKVQDKEEENKRLRDDVYRLKNQYDDLVAQRSDAEANVKRQRDLLFQAKGILERLRLRAKLLDVEEGKGGYDNKEIEKPEPAAARLKNTFKN
jgi:chromosome segregation ATPase